MNSNYEASELGKVLKEYRIKHNLTQAQLGKRIGISANTIHLWETKNIRPNVRSMQNISKEIGIPLGEIMTMARNPSWLETIENGSIMQQS